MRLTDDNYHEYKAFYSIPEDFHMFREHYHFGNCPTFRGIDTPMSEYKYIYSTSDGVRLTTRTYTWAELRELLRDTWRPVSSEGRQWYLDNIAA